jgi:hypothetical protein
LLQQATVKLGYLPLTMYVAGLGYMFGSSANDPSTELTIRLYHVTQHWTNFVVEGQVCACAHFKS